MSGKAPRDKGMRFERLIVNTFLDAGISSERVPLSGSAGGSYTADLTAAILGDDQRFEAKCRGSGFTKIYEWMEGVYGVCVKRDRSEPLVVLRLDDFAKLALIADRARLAEGVRTYNADPWAASKTIHEEEGV